VDEDTRTARAAVSANESNRTPEEIRADIERTRGQVGDTVEALAAKTDVKARVQDRVEELKEKVPSGPQEGGNVVVAKVRANPLPVIGVAVVALAFLIGRRSAQP
jgi:hypothetical protein